MEYVIFGAGGTGCAIGFYLTKAGKDVTMIARGDNLRALKEDGLEIRHLWNTTKETLPIQAVSEENYEGTPDVIFICVKGYSIESVLPFLKKHAGPETVIIPILNIYGTGGALQRKLPGYYVLDGCIYVSASRIAPGVLVQHGPILRVVFGPRKDQEVRSILPEIEKDITVDGIQGILSQNIERDCLEKFSYVSPIGAAGLYYHATAGDFQREGKERDLFRSMIQEIQALASAMGFPFEKDYVEVNLRILSGLSPDADTSMQRDVASGHRSEIDGLVHQVVRLGEQYHVNPPMYKMVDEELKRRGIN
ncbi:MAG: 2-dehydropantoate 2-reductase [Lachnospiraceae bacterium]|nr:2-dehydropantoate 2-reductase [Lachnospiraceae bacterium]